MPQNEAALRFLGGREPFRRQNRDVMESEAPPGPGAAQTGSCLRSEGLLGLVTGGTSQTGPARLPPGPRGSLSSLSGCEQRRVPQQIENMGGFRWRPEVTWKPLPDQQDPPVQGLHCWTLSHCPGDQRSLGRGAGQPLSGPRGHEGLDEQTAKASHFHPVVQFLPPNWSPSSGQMSQGWGPRDRERRDWQADVWGQGRARGLLQLD